MELSQQEVEGLKGAASVLSALERRCSARIVPSESSSEPGPSGTHSDGNVGDGGASSRSTGTRFDRALSAALQSLRKGREDAAKREERQIFGRKRYDHQKFTPKGKKKAKRPTPWTRSFYCLGYTDQHMAPITEEEKDSLYHAGLGKKKITVPDVNCSFDELCDILLENFPKLSTAGGFEFLHCRANSKALDPFSDLAQTTPIVLAERSGKGIVYIRPIQKDLVSVKENSRDKPIIQLDQRTEKCLSCSRHFPLVHLRQHLSVCDSKMELFSSGSDSDFDLPRTFHRSSVIEVSSSHSTPPSTASPQAPSTATPPTSPPATQHDLEIIEQNMIDTAIEQSLQSPSAQPSTTAECVRKLQNEVGLHIPDIDEEWFCLPRMEIDVRRDFLLEDALKEGHKTRFDPTKLLKVCFVGEGAIDTGGPTREFCRLLLQAVQDKYCIGVDYRKVFDHNVPALQMSHFRVIGMYVAISMLHGGQGFSIFHPALFHYIVSGEYLGQQLSISHVPVPSVRALLTMLENAASDTELRALFLNSDENCSLMFETGFRRPIASLTMSDVPEISKLLCEYYTIIRIKPELDQFCDGLAILGVTDAIRNFPNLMRPLFVKEEFKKLGKGYFKNLLSPVWSRMPSDRKKQESAYVYFLDFLDELEDGTVHCESGDLVTFSDVLVFFTGADEEPPLGFFKSPELIFRDETFATSSTCDMTLRLPTKYSNYSEFRDMFVEALKGHGGFGNA